MLSITVAFLFQLLHLAAMVFLKEEAEFSIQYEASLTFHNVKWILLHESHTPVIN